MVFPPNPYVGSGSDQHNLGWYLTEAALILAHPTAVSGDYAIVGETDTVWTWDADTVAWVNTGSTSVEGVIEEYFNVPSKTAYKQVPYRPPAYPVEGPMNNGPLVEDIYYFTTEKLKASIYPTYWFGDDAARDTYFVAHPGDLTEGRLVYSWYRYQVYIGSAWVDQDEFDLVYVMMDNYYEDNPTEVYEGALRAYNASGEDVYQRYTESWETLLESDLDGFWLPATHGCENLALFVDTTNQKEGEACIKTTFNISSASDWYGGGLKITGVSLVGITEIKVWVKGSGDAIGKEVKIVSPFYSTESNLITGSWEQLTFAVDVSKRLIDQTIEIVAGEANSGDESYVVYWDDLEIGGDQKKILWIEDIDTYFHDVYEFANPNIQAHVTSAHAPADAEKNVQTDWNQTDTGADDYLKNKPSIGAGSTDNAVIRANGTEGTAIQNSLVIIDDSGSVDIPSGQHYKINNANLAASDVGALSTALKGSANGVAELDGTGKVPAGQLPSYVDDVLEYADLAAFPVTGTSGIIYVAIDTNMTYRWSGTVYVEISTSVALGETSTTAYRGDRGKTAYDHAVKVHDGTVVDIHATTQETSVSNSDEIMVYDASAGANRRMIRSDFVADIGVGALIQRILESTVYETSLMYWVAPAACVIESLKMALITAPSAASTYCKIQVMKNGILETDSVFTSDVPMEISNSTSVTNGVYQASGTLDSGLTTLAAGDVIHFRVNQADTGSSGLLVQMMVMFT